MLDHAVDGEIARALPEMQKGLAQRQPHNGQHGLARRTQDLMRVIGALHGRTDHVLAVDQGAVAIEDDQFHIRLNSGVGPCLQETARQEKNVGSCFVRRTIPA